jgi:predicted TIM-barrel fold metal-dependent hydrolase
MRVITLEEHFATPLFLEGPGQDLKKAALKFEGRAMKLIEPLCDIGDKRLAAMDAAGIDFQMLSLTSPGTEQLDAAEAIALARDANDAVAEAVKQHPKRFGGFAALPTMMPDKAAAELEQRVRSGAFKGAVINGHVRGRYLDDKFSGRSWNAPRRSMRRSTSIRPSRRSRCSTLITAAFHRW